MVRNEILKECKIIRQSLPDGLPAGDAVITGGGRLKAKKIIHTVGPIWHGGGQKEAGFLAQAYENSLALAMKNGIKTISFPSISTGAYGYPINRASKIALSTVIGFVRKNDWFDEIRFVLHSGGDFLLYEECCRMLLLNGRGGS
ncbi:MAG: macro domain-containing protein [Candidatus Methanoperedens sp.]|nr:macro domain-containing protein [Candidatus Methanoperedens sp.]